MQLADFKGLSGKRKGLDAAPTGTVSRKVKPRERPPFARDLALAPVPRYRLTPIPPEFDQATWGALGKDDRRRRTMKV